MEHPNEAPTVIYEDDVLLVLNKPFGYTVNRSDTTRNEITLQDFVDTNFTFQSNRSEDNGNRDFYARSGLVHRIDKETSGILIGTKTPESFSFLQQQFKDRSVKKTYRALIHGIIIPEEGEINVPVGRLPWNRMHFGVVAGGREALTRYKVIAVKNWKQGRYKEELSLIEAYPQTGRTHQIRVHFQYLRHPVFADPLYVGRKQTREDRKALSRLFLHAAKISFLHPVTNNPVTFESPLPHELSSFLQTLTD